MSTIFKHIVSIYILFFLFSCTSMEETNEKKIQIPGKITLLFLTQPSCPSCDQLEETMGLSEPKNLLDKFFIIKKVYLGEELPDGLIKPNGTPTVYFLGANNEALLEPMVGEQEKENLMVFLEDALLEFKNIYKVDLIEKLQNKKIKENNETTN